MKVKWVRSGERIIFNRPYTWLVLGVRGCLPLNEEIITAKGVETIEEFVQEGGGLVLSDEQGILKYNVGMPIFKGFQIVYRIKMNAGLIMATSEHPFLTEQGWKKVLDLQVGDNLYILKNIPKTSEVCGLFGSPKEGNHEVLRPVRKRVLCYAFQNKAFPLLFKGMSNEIPSSASHQRTQGENSTIHEALFEGTSTPENRDRKSLQVVRKENLRISQSSKEGTRNILLSKLPYEMEKQIQQPLEASRSKRENERIKEGLLCENDKRRNKKEESSIDDLRREEQACRRGMDQEDEGNKGIIRHEEKVLSRTSRETSKRSVTTRQNDSIREKGGGNLKTTGVITYLEQSNSFRSRMEVPRFSDSEHKHSNRVQRNLLAQPKARFREEKAFREAWLQSYHVGRAFNKARNKSHYQRATILSILPENVEPVYDLHVENAHNFFLANGILTHNSGKSSQLEHIGEHYLAKGHCVLDLFGSRDGENLAWLRSRWAKDKEILLIHGDGIEVETNFPVKNVKDVRLKDFTDYDILISASPLYASADQQFLETNKLTDLLYKRFTWKRLIYTIVREASNLYYSRLKISENQLVAKAGFIYMLREARHMGVAMGLDTLRFYAVDIDIRSLADYTMFKSQGVPGLAKDLKWLYRYFEPSLIRNMRPEQFVILTRKGGIGQGVFPEIPWHKQERENIMKSVGLRINHVKPSEAREDEARGTYFRVGDATHAKIISLHVEGLGYQKIADELNIASTRTPHSHVGLHNRSIKTVGYCPRCRRVNGEYADKRA